MQLPFFRSSVWQMGVGDWGRVEDKVTWGEEGKVPENHIHSGLVSAGRKSMSISIVKMLKFFYASWLMTTAYVSCCSPIALATLARDPCPWTQDLPTELKDNIWPRLRPFRGTILRLIGVHLCFTWIPPLSPWILKSPRIEAGCCWREWQWTWATIFKE